MIGKSFIRNRKAESGIGTLIIFIAMIIVASIGANVLIQTSSTLQSKALETARQAKENVASRLQLITLRGQDGSDGDLEELRSQMKLAPGSSSIDLEKMIVSLSVHNASVNLVYSDEDCQLAEPSGNGFYSNTTTENGTFTVHYDQTINNHRHGIIQRGEVVTICMQTPGKLKEDQMIEMQFIPKVGLPTKKTITTDDVIVNQNIILYP